MSNNYPERSMIRLPDGLREKIKADAKQNHRTMNAQVVMHLDRIYGEQSEKK